MKTGILHMQKQRRSSAAEQRLSFRYMYSDVPLLSKSEISSHTYGATHVLFIYEQIFVCFAQILYTAISIFFIMQFNADLKQVKQNIKK